MSRKRSKDTTTDRDTIDIASDYELVRSFIKQNTFSPAPLLHLPPPKFNLKPLEDRRAFHPDGKHRSIAALPTSAKRLKVAAAPVSGRALGRPRSIPSGVSFTAPNRVVLCVRRKVRAEVLHALGRTKKGGRRKLNSWSHMKCSTRS